MEEQDVTAAPDCVCEGKMNLFCGAEIPPLLRRAADWVEQSYKNKPHSICLDHNPESGKYTLSLYH
jgi:hypothetical protein